MHDSLAATDGHSVLPRPVALTIAGSDSGGGAGIQADLRAFSAFGVYGTTAITAVTAQNPHGVSAVQGGEPAILDKQLAAVAAAFSVGAIKTGMLLNTALIAVVATGLERFPGVPVVVDPVMVATSGARLLAADAVSALRERIICRALLTTPNLPEAEILVDMPIGCERDMAAAACRLRDEFGGSFLVKGGHREAGRATDMLADGGGVWRISAPVVDACSTHGTGCSLSAACAAALANGCPLLEAVVQAKAYVLGALRGCCRIGPRTWGMWPAETLPVHEIVCEKISI